MRLLPRVLTGLAAVALVPACGTNENTCKTQDGITLCGDFGHPLYVANLGGEPVQWPPVAIENGRIIVARGSQLLEVSADGTVAPLRDMQHEIAAPSQDETGNLYVVGGNSANSTVSALNAEPGAAVKLQSSPRWTASLPGRQVGTPPSVGADHVYAATVDGALYVLDRTDGAIVRKRVGASPAAVLTDGSIRFLAGANGNVGVAGGGAPRYGKLVAEKADGTVMWNFTDANGIVDFAPGPAGETYIVTAGNNALRRVSANGTSDWSFTPKCQDCNVAAAPTVTGNTVYFPVWENRVQNPVDPLFALSAADGKLLWTFDGFDTKDVSYAPYKSLSGSQPVDQTRTTHHPSGRPVVAQDGTMYVSNDGAVAALDANGQMLGLAMYDASAGEVHWTDTFVEPVQTWINPGVRPSPVLGPDGTLYVWDGVTVRAFRTGRPAAAQAWIAPYGGPTNSGRMQ